MSWEKLSMAKSEGGLGFQDLEAFNLALLHNKDGDYSNIHNPWWLEFFGRNTFEGFLCWKQLWGKGLLMRGIAYGIRLNC